MATKKKNLKYYLINITISMVTVLVMLAIVDLIFGKNEGTTDTGQDWQAYNDSINQRNFAYAQLNPYGFTDSIRSMNKPDSVFRIAVLGDSFIWGDGIPHEWVWSHKLERLVLDNYDHVEVIHWGRNGWSTKDQLNFYVTEGRKYNIDLLLIGLVDNDPDLNLYKDRSAEWRMKYDWWFRTLPGVSYWIFNKYATREYDNWLDSLYSTNNLNQYEQVLIDLDTELQKDSVDYSFVYTANCTYPHLLDRYSTIEDLMIENNIPYYDLIPGIVEVYSDIDCAQLKASPVNGHPGPEMTTFFADSTFAWLQRAGYLE